MTRSTTWKRLTCRHVRCARNMFGYHDRKDEGRYGNLRTSVGEEIAHYRFDASAVCSPAP